MFLPAAASSPVIERLDSGATVICASSASVTGAAIT